MYTFIYYVFCIFCLIILSYHINIQDIFRDKSKDGKFKCIEKREKASNEIIYKCDIIAAAIIYHLIKKGILNKKLDSNHMSQDLISGFPISENIKVTIKLSNNTGSLLVRDIFVLCNCTQYELDKFYFNIKKEFNDEILKKGLVDDDFILIIDC